MPAMTRPELWAIIDGIAVAHPPGCGLRMTNIELVEWLNHVGASPRANRKTRQQAKKAARLVPKLIGPVYELPPPSATWAPPSPPAPKLERGPAPRTPTLFDEVPA